MTDTQLGRYHLIRVLGQGAMGIVHEALDPHLDRRVAVKTAHTRDLSTDQAAAYERRFLTEARSAARLRHPSIVSVFDAGKDGELAYLVMELVDGVNLKHCLNNGVRFTPAGAARLVWSVLGGLEHAHEQRVIHRDVKPENVLLDSSGVAKLTDFGIAKVLEPDMDNGTELAGLSIGTPRYMSPEQVRGLPVDARTDLYSAGVLLFELLTATTPFDGANHLVVASQILHDPAPLPSEHAPGVPPALDALVAKALAKSPDDRFQTAEAFRHALVEALDPMALSPTGGDGGTEPALALATPDAAPILRWLLAQACAHSPAVAASTAALVLPDVCVGEGWDTLPTPTTQVLPPVADPAPPVVPTPVRAKPWGWVALAVCVLGGAWWALGVGPTSAPQPFEEIIADTRVRPASTSAPTPAEPPAGHAPAATLPKPASADTTRAPRDAKAKAEAAKPVVASTEPGQNPAPAVSPAPKSADALAPLGPKPAPPREPCVGLSFLEREACLWKQCDTDTFRRHAVCKRFNPEKSDLPPR